MTRSCRAFRREGVQQLFLLLRIFRGSDTSSSGSFNLCHCSAVRRGMDRWDRSIQPNGGQAFRGSV